MLSVCLYLLSFSVSVPTFPISMDMRVYNGPVKISDEMWKLLKITKYFVNQNIYVLSYYLFVRTSLHP